MNNATSHHRLVSLTAGLLIALVAREMRTQPPTQNAAGISFENRQPQSGVDFVLNNGTTVDKPIIDSIPGGVALLDYDNDGFLDIFFTNGARIPSLSKEVPGFYNPLYHNNHDGTFTDVTEKAGLSGTGYSIGVAAADFDNDGWTDLYVTGINHNILYRNNHDGTFTDVTEKAGVSGVNSAGKKLLSMSAAWIDYDNDGRLDLFVTNYLDWSPETSKVCGLPGKRLSCPPSLYPGEPNILYHNNGDGTFTDVSKSTGIADQIGKEMGVAVADYDADGWTLYGSVLCLGMAVRCIAATSEVSTDSNADACAGAEIQLKSLSTNLNRNQFSVAEDRLTLLKAEHPDCSSILLAEARIKASQGAAEARDLFSRYLEKVPNDPAGLAYLHAF
jgi:FG-GAP-like repeat